MQLSWVHAANIQDRYGVQPVLAKVPGRFPRLRLIWADAAYAGRPVEMTNWVRGGDELGTQARKAAIDG